MKRRERQVQSSGATWCCVCMRSERRQWRFLMEPFISSRLVHCVRPLSIRLRQLETGDKRNRNEIVQILAWHKQNNEAAITHSPLSLFSVLSPDAQINLFHSVTCHWLDWMSCCSWQLFNKCNGFCYWPHQLYCTVLHYTTIALFFFFYWRRFRSIDWSIVSFR